MTSDYLPSADADLLAWSANFSAKITATPTAYGLTAALATALAAKQTAYDTALAAATNPQTRGGSTVLAKDQARAELVQYCRQLARAIQGTLAVTDQQRYDLGLTVRGVVPTPIPAPASAPAIMLASVIGRTVSLRLIDPANPTRRGKPDYVDGAAVFSFVGAEAPTDLTDWKFEGNTTRTLMDVVFPTTVAPGTKVWLAAYWFNPRAQRGPACAPVACYVQYGGAMAA
jgi:hypothetical protein